MAWSLVEDWRMTILVVLLNNNKQNKNMKKTSKTKTPAKKAAKTIATKFAVGDHVRVIRTCVTTALARRTVRKTGTIVERRRYENSNNTRYVVDFGGFRRAISSYALRAV